MVSDGYDNESVVMTMLTFAVFVAALGEESVCETQVSVPYVVAAQQRMKSSCHIGRKIVLHTAAFRQIQCVNVIAMLLLLLLKIYARDVHEDHTLPTSNCSV